MSSSISSFKTSLNIRCHAKVLTILFVLALLSSSFHLSLHDMDDSGLGLAGHQECQLSHLSWAPAPLIPSALLATLSGLLLVVFTHQYIVSSAFQTPTQARAPPLS